MKKVIRLENLDCANCAAKMENRIKKIDGISGATVSFMTQKMILEIEEARSEQILGEVKKVCAKVEPDCVLHI
ncbi:MAG: cation transporter [Candidatus Neoclostridium sp.]